MLLTNSYSFLDTSIGDMEYRRLGKTDEKIPVIGIGTWRVGGAMTPDYSHDEEAVEAIRYAISLGMTHIDTAEIYGAGHSEELVGRAIKDMDREKLFIATKVWYTNLRFDDVINACKNSLNRLNLKYVDLYIIHWPSNTIPLQETMKAMERLYKEGKIRYIGVSNFNVDQLEEARQCLSITDVVSNQVEYSLYKREIEKDLLPYCQRSGITITAYRPLGLGNISKEINDSSSRLGGALRKLAMKYGKTPVQVALNWVIWNECVVTIPKAIQKAHIAENAGAAGWRLEENDYRFLSSI